MDTIKGIVSLPPRILIYGPGGIGKTTLALGASNPLVIQGERGSFQWDVERYPKPKTWAEFLAQFDTAIAEWPAGGTIVIDTIDGLIPLLHTQICKEGGVRSLEAYGKGFGKGFERTAELLKLNLWPRTEACQDSGKMLLILAHCKNEMYSNPTGLDYHRWVPNMNTKAWGAIYTDVDCCFFIDIDGAVDGEKKLSTEGRRVLATDTCGAYAAKNRYSMPVTIPLPKEGGWDIVEQHWLPLPELASRVESAGKERGKDVSKWIENNRNNRWELIAALGRLAK